MVPRHAIGLHGPEQLQCAIGVEDTRKPLHEHRVSDGVALNAALPLMEKCERILNLVTLDKRIDHAPENDLRRCTNLFQHDAPNLPSPPGAAEGLAALDEQTEEVCATLEFAPASHVAADDAVQSLVSLRTYASFKRCLHGAYVKARNNIRPVEDGQSFLRLVRGLGIARQPHHDRNDVRICNEAQAVYLVEHSPRILKIQLSDKAPEQASERGSVRLVPALPHAVHHVLELLYLPEYTIAFHHGVERDAIPLDTLLLHVLEEFERAIDVFV
mmetsp:Transcript_67947/g.196798  ORF Transcript_67947/g.196798 Transcript_67947/m.196798 type:complete len:272 (+) Transcript_67947:976-1791(+)